MLNPLDDTLAQKVILLMTGVPGTVAMRDEVSRLIKAGDPNELSAYLDNVMVLKGPFGKDGDEAARVTYVLDSGFGINVNDLTLQKLDQITADSLRQGVDSWTGLFSYAMDKVDNNVGKILGNRAEAADVFTGIVDELDVDVDVSHPLVQEWIDKIDASDESLSEAKDSVKDLIDELTTLPVLVDSNPSDDSTDIAIGQDIVLTFNKKVTAGSGDIVIVGSDGDTRTIAVTDSSQVTITGKTLILNPTKDLNKDTVYYVQLESGVIKDLVGHAFAGISDATTLNFRTINTIPPNSSPTTSVVTLAPIAEDNGERVITQAELLGFAHDVDGDTLTAAGLIKDFGNGMLDDNHDGTWSYTPDVHDDTDVRFSYTISDGHGGTVANFATLDILPASDFVTPAQTIELLKIYSGFFDAVPGKGNLSALQVAVNGGKTIAQVADLLANSDEFKFNIMAGKVTIADQVEVLMDHFGLTPGSTDPASADAILESSFTASILAGIGFGTIISDTVNMLSATSDPAFLDAAALLQNKVLVAGIYSQTNSSSNMNTLQLILNGVPVSSSFTITDALTYLAGQGIDSAHTSSFSILFDARLNGTIDNDTFLGPIAITGDLLHGKPVDTVGSSNTIIDLNGLDKDRAVLELGATGPVAINPTFEKVEVIDITSRFDATLDMSRISGVATVNSVSSTGELSLTNVGNIIELGLSNTNSGATVNFVDGAIALPNDFMKISLRNTDDTITINNTSTGSVEVLTLFAITDSGSISTGNNVRLEGTALTELRELHIHNNDSELFTLKTGRLDFLETVDASSSVGNIKLDLSDVTHNLEVTGVLTSGNTITGGSGDDTITSGSGNDVITSGPGNDVITGGIGPDTIDGGIGNDTYFVDYSDVNRATDSTINPTTVPAAGFDVVTVNTGDIFQFGAVPTSPHFVVTSPEVVSATSIAGFSGNDLFNALNIEYQAHDDNVPNREAMLIQFAGGEQFLIVDGDSGAINSIDIVIQLIGSVSTLTMNGVSGLTLG